VSAIEVNEGEDAGADSPSPGGKLANAADLREPDASLASEEAIFPNETRCF